MRKFLCLLCLSLKLSAYQFPTEEQLSPYWQDYFADVDSMIEENFWGNLASYKEASQLKDPYALQLCEMGYNFREGYEHPAPFYRSMRWIVESMQDLMKAGLASEETVLWPAKAFLLGEDDYRFIPMGKEPPEGAEVLNLLSPEVFVRMLSEGYFPVGEPIREHTNQTLAEHDLAHMAGFVSCPRYMAAVRRAFTVVGEKMKTNPRLCEALQHFDSLYSLRLYYMIEVFTLIPSEKHAELAELIELPLDAQCSLQDCIDFLKDKAQHPAELNRYLYRLYSRYPSLANPVAGESRDILNRLRKFQRGQTTGTFYDTVSRIGSKFDRSSIYSMYLNALAALEYKRSNHDDYLAAIEEIHAPFIMAVIDTSQLSVEDWVMESVEEVPNPASKLYRYLHDSGMWDEQHVLYWAYTHPDYDRVLTSEDML